MIELTTVPRDLYYTERKLVQAQADEIKRLRAALKEIGDLRCEDLPVSDGLPVDNLAALYARRALEQDAPK